MATKTRGGSNSVGTAHVYGVALSVYECRSCNVVYGASSSFIEERQHDGKTFYCPNGHSNVFGGPTEEERLRSELAATRDSLAYERSSHDQTRASLTATKAAKTRIKRDRDRLHQFVGAGQCPVPGCRRHLKDLARHMESCHPDWAPSD